MTTNLKERRKVSPPEYAARCGIACEKVITWIKSGELRAIDASTSRGERPRYLIDEADIEAFEAARQIVVVTPSPRRRKPSTTGIVRNFR